MEMWLGVDQIVLWIGPSHAIPSRVQLRHILSVQLNVAMERKQVPNNVIMAIKQDVFIIASQTLVSHVWSTQPHQLVNLLLYALQLVETTN